MQDKQAALDQLAQGQGNAALIAVRRGVEHKRLALWQARQGTFNALTAVETAQRIQGRDPDTRCVLHWPRDGHAEGRGRPARGAGSLVVLMGPSGSGKTTLLNLIGGLDQPTAGSISVAGRRLDQLSGQELAELRRTIGFIFQSFALLPTASAYENVELGLLRARKTKT